MASQSRICVQVEPSAFPVEHCHSHCCPASTNVDLETMCETLGGCAAFAEYMKWINSFK